jgi:hypothetical protein
MLFLLSLIKHFYILKFFLTEIIPIITITMFKIQRPNKEMNMNQFAKLILIPASLLFCGFANPTIRRGEVVYSHEEGKMKCLSQKDPQGNIAILVKGIKPNTRVDFLNILLTDPNKAILEVLMVVERESTICNNWTEYQRLFIPIDPKRVKTLSLCGRVTHRIGKYIILSPI